MRRFFIEFNKFRKENKYLIIAILVFILCFLNNWYWDIILQSLFTLSIVPIIIIFLIYNIFLILTIIDIVRTKKKSSLVALIIYIIIPIFSIFFPFRECRVNLEIWLYKKQREDIIINVKNKDYVADENGNIKLPKNLKKVSTSGEVTVYENDNDGVLICFWIMRGVLSGSVQLMYSSGDEALIYKNETGHKITNVEKLKDNWYLVETDY